MMIMNQQSLFDLKVNKRERSIHHHIEYLLEKNQKQEKRHSKHDLGIAYINKHESVILELVEAEKTLQQIYKIIQFPFNTNNFNQIMCANQKIKARRNTKKQAINQEIIALLKQNISKNAVANITRRSLSYVSIIAKKNGFMTKRPAPKTKSHAEKQGIRLKKIPAYAYFLSNPDFVNFFYNARGRTQLPHDLQCKFVFKNHKNQEIYCGNQRTHQHYCDTCQKLIRQKSPKKTLKQE